VTRYAFIFARGGSKGLPRKNVKMLAGKPMITYSIETAFECGLFSKVFVSTDDKEIADISEASGAEIISRPSDLAGDKSPEWLSWQHAVDWVQEAYGDFDDFVSLPATSPLRSKEDVLAAIEKRASSGADVCISVTEASRSPYFNMVTLDAEQVASIVIRPDEGVYRRQDAPEVFDITTVVYATTPQFITKNTGLFDGEIVAIEIPKERAVDIDDIYDFLLAEAILNEQYKKMMFKGKTFLVAGASGLLGSKIVAELLSEGAAVIAADINGLNTTSKLISEGVDVDTPLLSIREIDVTSEEEVKCFFGDLTDLDGAVNATYPRNSQYGAHFYDVSMASFNENVSLHLGSAFLLSQQCAAFFERVGKPFSLVNFASIYGVVAPKFEIYDNTPMTMPVEYAAIKSAIIHLNKYIAAYVKNSNFRINCISPGGLLDGQPDAFVEKYQTHTLGTGMLSVDDMLGSILFLLSDSAKYVNGQNIIVDDGFTI
jgi:CMP-N-acetylneuraminic acid synthetase/NAD(P)-dependent dehydrogenase (short-subunit alcohol dehydrogenase family)